MSRIAIFMVIARLIGFNDVTARLEFLSIDFQISNFCPGTLLIFFLSINIMRFIVSLNCSVKLSSILPFRNHLTVVSMHIVPSTFCDVYRQSENHNHNNKNTKQQQQLQQK